MTRKTTRFQTNRLSGILGAMLGTSAGLAQAALPSNAVLYFSAGYKTCLLGGTAPDNCLYGVKTTKGSWFSMDSDGNGSVSDSEKTPISPKYGLAIGTTQPTSGESHSGLPTGSEGTSIDQAWNFFGNTGMHNTTVAISVVSDDGAGNVVLNMAGWRVDWNGIEDINMGGDTANFA